MTMPVGAGVRNRSGARLVTPIHYLSAGELVSAYAEKKLSRVEVVRHVLHRIENVDASVNAFCLVDSDAALRDARDSEARWMKGAPTGRRRSRDHQGRGSHQGVADPQRITAQFNGGTPG